MEKKLVSFDEIIFSYGPFKLFKIFKVVGVNSFLLQNLIVGIFFFFTFLLSAFLDKSFILPGENIGLLEHPSIWIFLALQILLPFTQSKAIKIFYEIPHWDNQIIQKKYFSDRHQIIIKKLADDLSLKSPKSKAIFRTLVFAGLMSFIWNSYQNQFPLKFLGFDFWDSINHTSGYWITRLFKLYIWSLLFPFCLFSQLMITRSVLKEVKEASMSNQVDLIPFYNSHYGGFNQFIIKTINPLRPFFVISGLHAFLIIIIHGKLDYTPLLGITLFIVIISFLYLFPVLNIRKIIIKEKNKKIGEINKERNEILKSLDFKDNIDKVSNISDLLKNLTYIKDSYEGIPNWPGIHYLTKVIGLSYSPALVSFIFKIVSQFVMKY
jgi:hypothetical protein